jgi:hypothetical protein
MKNKEEIEQLAQITYPKDNELDEYCGFIKGYIQCLIDIRKDWQSYTISEKSDFIEFLNKQD